MAVLRARLSLRNATTVGERARVYGSPIVDNLGELAIGDRAQIFSRVAKTELVVGRGAVLKIGTRVLIMDGASICATEQVSIGDDCLFARHVQILDNAFHFVDPQRRLEVPPSEPVVIGHNVWLASRAIVLPGVTIGDGAAVAAGAVVSSNVAPKTLVGGVPARKIRDL